MPVKRLECEGVAEDLSVETVKENTSAVDSSLTECKHDIENCDGPESSISKDNEEQTAGAKATAFSQENGSSPVRSIHIHTRYFIIKSLSHDNIHLSVQKGIWATQIMNEPILEEAFHNSERVILIFSVNMSGFFQGYAQMMSSVGWRRDNVWSKSTGGSNPWGRSFKVKWLRLYDLPFQKTLHLKNPLNDYKPVKISRDCQELPADIGEALCALFDLEGDVNGNLKRNNCFMDDNLLKRPCRNSPIHFQVEDCILSAPSSHVRWSRPTMLHPSLLFQNVAQLEELEGSTRVSFLQNSPFLQESENIPHMKQPFIQRSLNNRQRERDEFHQSNSKDIPRDGKPSVSFSEDDILDMTYEEYLQAIGRSSLSSSFLAAAAPMWDHTGLHANRD